MIKVFAVGGKLLPMSQYVEPHKLWAKNSAPFVSYKGLSIPSSDIESKFLLCELPRKSGFAWSPGQT